VRRNHTGHRVGEAHQKAKLSDEDVRVMREMREEKGWSYAKLAKHFDCGESTARDIIKYRTRWYA